MRGIPIDLTWRKNEERTRDDRRSGFLMLNGGGLGLMKDTAGGAFRMYGAVIVIVESQGNRKAN